MYGTKILQAVGSQSSQQLFSLEELRDMFGGVSCSMANSVVVAANGDWTANECQVTTFCTNTAWHVGFSSAISGPVRINYVAIRF